jgi:adenosine deaminase
MADLDPDALATFVRGLPKAELHLHLEGTLEPELMFEIAKRNGVTLRFDSVEAVHRAYAFEDLQSFLDIYYEGAACLIHERDFHDLAWAYLDRMATENVRHVEVFFDPQTHTDRGVAFETVVTGLHRALEAASESLGITSRLILCFLRHLSEDAALRTLEEARPFLPWIAGVGLDSSEVGHPPGKFARAFRQARGLGLHAVAHAGEEGPPAYIWEALDVLEVERIDHGVRCEEDPALLERIVAEGVPLTVCPLSNVRLRVFDRMEDHNLGRLLARGARVTLNSDDPAYFGGYLSQNYLAAARALHLDRADLGRLARHGFEAAFLEPAVRARYLAELDAYLTKAS